MQWHVKKYDIFTVILGGSMVTDVKGWELSNDQQIVVVKSFRGAKANLMHAKLTIEKNPKNIIHCGTNDLSKDADPEKIAADIINLSKSVGEKSGSKVIGSYLVPHKGCLNAKVRNVNNMLPDFCGYCTFFFLKQNNINAKAHCNISALHLNSKGVSMFNEKFVNLLYAEDLEN